MSTESKHLERRVLVTHAPSGRRVAMQSALQTYAEHLGDSRRRLKVQPELRLLMDSGADPQRLHAFLLQWAALSIQAQEPAERYLVSASRRCAEIGEQALSLALLRIASEAIERYRLIADDTRRLTELWNRTWTSHINLTDLLTQPASPTTKRLHGLQAAIVDGPQPWTLLALIYEIEAVLATVARRVGDQAEELLGADVRACLRSLDAIEHFAERGSLRRAMVDFLDGDDSRVTAMVEVGDRGSELYLDFLVECCDAAANLARRRDPQRAFG